MAGIARLALLVALLLGGAGAAMADIVIVCGRTSPITEMSRDQAERLYLGRLSALPSGAPVSPVDLPVGAVREQFYHSLTGKNPNQIRAYWSRQVFAGRAAPPREAASVAEVRSLLAKYPDLVGYLPAGDVDVTMRVLLKVD
jgi:hypothetical protein